MCRPAQGEDAAAQATRPRGSGRRGLPYNRDGNGIEKLRPPASRALAALNRTDAYPVNVEQQVIAILRTALDLGPAGSPLDADTPLLGSVAELDSMAVVSILTALEERFGIVVDDDEVDSRTFASVGSLTRFVQSKLEQ
jgi:acyl carrier protein